MADNKADNPLITWQKEMIAEQLKRLDDQILLRQWPQPQPVQPMRDIPEPVIQHWKGYLQGKKVIAGETIAQLPGAEARALMLAMQEDRRQWWWDSSQQVYTCFPPRRGLKQPNHQGVIDYLVERAREM